METENFKKAREIFQNAIEIEDRTKREQYLESACEGDEKLRAEVEKLLKAHKEAGSFLEVPALDPNITLDKSPLVEKSGTVIDRYKLLEKIGEGGMAAVYMAEQKRPIRRKVAFKIIKLGMDTKEVIARFEVERQALAMMDHPNIAKVLDAGATETGRPYFVMELVKGISITEYCDKNKLSTRDRLDLFIQVCNAVQHAHQKGIIHRDIKPSNVMITMHDGRPVPKVIDFGIAKATNQQLTEKTLFTRYAHMIGTPEYMSPEQAEMSGLDIDTRSDIYSLGVLLYELLTGSTPFDADHLRKAGYGEMQRIIREEEPTKPSTKLSTLGDTLTAIAEHRRTNPVLLRKLMRGDLDWIVMKSIEKDRVRRYESVDAMAADVQRHLNHEPVLAGSPGVIYRLRKFSRKHRAALAAAAGILVIISLGLFFTVMYARVVNQRRKDREAIIAKERIVADQVCLWEAQKLYDEGRYAEGLSKVGPILASETVGEVARLLYGQLLRPEPADGADIGVRQQVRLGWIAGSDVVSHKVYFGSSPDDLTLLCLVQGDSYTASPRLQSCQWYCWRVDAVRSDGSVIEGQPFSFSTGSMIAWWKFEPTETRQILDSSGNALHGNLVADAHIVSDPQKGNVLNLDGNDDCVQIKAMDDKFNFTTPINYLTSAVSPLDTGSKPTFLEVETDMRKLVNGTNVLAVELHRAEGSSSDIGFDLFLAGPTNIRTLVLWGSIWKYLDDGSDQGTAWYDPTFDDSSWASGPAELGHGDGDESTVVSWGPDEGERYVTTYFRHSFNVPDVSIYKGLHLGIKRDDGAVVYLNGKEVFRDNMPDGTITYMTRASISKYNPTSWFGSCFVDANNLVDGINVLAVEVHQRLGGSGDISFDLLLADSTDLDTLVRTDADWKHLNDGSDQGSAWFESSFDDVGWASGSTKLICDSANDKNVTTYFRHSFNIPDASIYQSLRLGIMSDDGAVVYLNGNEIGMINMPCSTITLSAWVKAQSFNSRWSNIFSKGNAWNLNVITDSKTMISTLQFIYGSVISWDFIDGNKPIEIGKWYHVAAVCDGTKICLYVNGKLDNSKTDLGTISTNDYPVVIGENSENVWHEFNGLIDDARIYSYALSAAEVNALYRGNGPGPVEKPKWAVSVVP